MQVEIARHALDRVPLSIIFDDSEPVLKVGETVIFCYFRGKINRF